jgi:hypothetical protein
MLDLHNKEKKKKMEKNSLKKNGRPFHKGKIKQSKTPHSKLDITL